MERGSKKLKPKVEKKVAGSIGEATTMSDITERKRMEDALRESEERLRVGEAKYRLLADNVSDVIWTADMNMNTTYISPSIYAMQGHTPEEAINLTPEQRYTPESLEMVSKLFMEAMANEAAGIKQPDYIGTYQSEYIRKDGSTYWTETKASVIRDPDGKAVGILGVTRDISQSRKTQIALCESEERFRRVSQITTDIAYSCLTDQEGAFSVDWMSGAVEQTTGYTADEIMAQSCWRFLVVEEDIPLFEKNVSGLSLGQSAFCDLRICHKHGEIIWVRSFAECIAEIGTSKEPRLYGGLRNITDSKKAEEKLRKSEAQYRLLAEHTADIVALMDMDLKVTYQSPSSEKLRGYTLQELKELPMEKNLAPESLNLALEALNRELPGIEADPGYNPVTVLEIEYYRKDGTTVWLESKFSIIRDVSGKPVSILLEARDVTERKLAEGKLLKSYESVTKTLNDAINTMVKIVELRDPYTSGHQQKVADLATAIAKEMKLEDTRIYQLRTAAMIHDIGKMYIPSDILSKPGKLSGIELDLIKTHAQSGYDIVKSMDFPCDIAKAVLQHHERLDGSGYPNQLKGEDTLLEAKILAVADVVEAMSSHRPYRPALGIDAALNEISKNKGKLYDSAVVDACMKLFNSGRFEFKTI